MSKNNRMQQPYGYREQNKFTSESSMICDAISAGDSDKDIIKQLVEKLNIIFNKAFVNAQYNKDNEEFEFRNYYGAEVGNVEFPFIVKDASYDKDSEKIIVTFKDETVDPVEIDMSDLVSLINDEAVAREDEDQRLWDAIGEIGASGTSLMELIAQEASARTEGDEDLWDALNQEISARTDGDASLEDKIGEEESARTEEDQKIWDAIGEIGASGTSLVEIIEQEISARTEGDEDLWDALNQEISARTEEDQKIWDAIGEMGASGMSLVEMIENEISARTEGDNDLWNALNQEISARTDADVALEDKIGEEESARTETDEALKAALSAETEARQANDSWLNDKINQEISNRENADNDLWEALNQEISARTEGDTALNEELDQEKLDRAAADGELEGKIDVEKAEREAADNELDGKITAEKNARLYWDNQLSGDVQTEKAEREAEDEAIWAALSAETGAREAADEALSDSIEANKVSIVKIETALPSNVREAYELKNTSGEVLGARINIYKDSSLKDVELTDHDDSGHTGQFLMFTYILEDGTEKVEYLDVSQFLVEAEFKDGLVVNNAGEVRVKIDPTSEVYITVSPSGLKITGIDAIADALAAETIARENADTRLETAITNESTARQSADIELNNAITAETSAREDADNDLDRKISEEKAQRIADDAALSVQIATETTNRTNADQSLNRLVTQVSEDLSNEVSNRTNADTLLQEQINGLKSADIEIRSSIATVENNLLTETSNRSQADADLQLQINKKANSVDVYYKTEADSIFATKAEIPTDFYSKAEVDEKDTAIKQMITAETAAREAEDARLNNAITAETDARDDADERLQASIDAIETQLNSKLVEVKTKDASISVDNTNATKPEIKVNISTEEDQIVKLNADGIYAKSKLSYDEEHNILIYTNTTGTTAIALKTKSEIDRIYYDKPNERIVIEYTVNGTRKEDVYVPVHDLIQEWRTEDGNVGAIALTKDVSIPEVDVLKARLILNTAHGDNAAIIDDNALYVSKSAIVAEANAEIEALKARVTALENALQIATQEHTTQSQRITQVEQKNASQDDQITEINTKNQSQDESIQDLLNYINVNTEP